ncbi:ABC transporter substrate-binding protein [Nonomuraea rubra]|uniref:ABC transporter substrate-binding protein n=1 Tax=Nonomuraea rubra TaxID=46180 RepID=UPI0033E902A2
MRALLAGQVAAVAADSRFQIVGSPSARTHYPTFNASREPFSGPRLREAAGLAIDRRAIAGTLPAGTATPGAGFLSPAFGDLAGPDTTVSKRVPLSRSPRGRPGGWHRAGGRSSGRKPRPRLAP